MVDKMLDIQIVRALSAIGPLTRKQIINRVNDNTRDVEASLDALVMLGKLRAEVSQKIRGDFEYRLAPNFTERDCKMSAHREKVAQYVAKHGSDSKAVLPAENAISFADGLPRALWKAANTGKWWVIPQIVGILTSVGFRKRDVVDAINCRISEGTWFERTKGRNGTFFKLRNDVPCPSRPGEKVLPKFVLPSEPKDNQIAASANVVSTDAAATADRYFPISSLNESTLTAVHEAAKLLIKEDGTLHEAIWAVMQDNEEYSCSDLVTILRPFGYTEKQISPLLSKRFADGLLRRRQVEVGGKWVFVYERAGELPEKFTSNWSVVSGIIEAQASTEGTLIAPQQNVKTETKVEATCKVFDHTITIKGIQIGMDEVKDLYGELYREGFLREASSVDSDRKPRMIKTTHEIKGVQFSREELLELTSAMHKTATEFQQILLVG